MTSLNARRLVAHDVGRSAYVSVLRAVGLMMMLAFATAARADAVDDTLAKFLVDKFSQTEAAVSELAAEAPPQAAAILDALGDNRLMIDPADHIVAYKTAAGALLDAKTGKPVPDSSAAGFKKVRVNNALRSAIEGAMGSLTLANPDPGKRLAAAEDVFRTHDAKALPALQAQLAKESDSGVAAALKLAQASIFATSDSASPQDRLSAIATLKERGDQDAQSLIDEIAQKATDPAVKSAAETALSAIHARLALWSVAQNLWYGISASSVLLLAAIGLAITFGVMGVINMAHGEMVMLGAYSTYVVQTLLPPSLQNWSLAFAIPLAFVVAGVVGIAIERLVIRFLYTRPLETLLATWGVSLILQQLVRSLFGAANRQVSNPPFMSGRVRARRPLDHHQSPMDHRVVRRRLHWPPARPARDALRPADARGDAEPPHGGVDGHLDRAGRHARLRARIGGSGDCRRRAVAD